jgi:hypothetical protein
MLSPSVQESRSFTLHYILLTREKKKYFKIDTVATRKHCGKAPEDLHHMFPAQGQFHWKGSVVHESQNWNPVICKLFLSILLLFFNGIQLIEAKVGLHYSSC